MKKYFKYNLLIILIFLATSCSKDFLNIAPQDKLTAGNFYKNEADIRANTASLYGYPWFDFNDRLFWLAGDEMAGNVYYTYDQEGQFFYFTYTEGNAYISSGWKSLYRVVSYANSVINDMPVAATGVDQGAITRGVAEAKFVRAVAYYMIAELWGDAPIVENTTQLVTSNQMMLPRNTRKTIYQFMEKDLLFAEANLPATDAGRATKWAAKGMLAKLYLTWGQSEKSQTYFDKAKTYAADVITNSGLSLMTNYADLFKVENNNNPESLFALQFIQGAYGIGNSRQANWARGSIITQNTECWGGGISATYDFTQLVKTNDARRSAIYMTLGDVYPELNKKNGGYTYNIVTRSATDANTVLEFAAPVLNNMKKYVIGSSDDTGGKVTTGQATASNQYILRLADVYLIYTEAALGLGSTTSDATALQYMNTVRSRGGLDPLTTASFMDIFNERRVEFCGESLFWFDIKRFYYRDAASALSYINNQKRFHVYNRVTGTNVPDENTFAGYTITPPTTTATIEASKMFLPIPASEVLINPKLNQPAVDYIFQ